MEKRTDELAVSARALQRLLEERAREEDRRIADELGTRRALIEFREGLAARMGRVTDAYELARLILREAQGALGFDHGMLGGVGEDMFLELLASTEALPPRYRSELLEEAFIVGEPLHVGDRDAPLHALGNDDVPPDTALRALPFETADGRPLGVLVLEGRPTPGREAWVEPFLAMVAEALEDCRRYARLEGLIVDAAIAIARVHDARTPGQAGHTARVEGLSRELARALGLGATEVKRVRLFALLHDLTAAQVAAGFQAIRRGRLTAAAWKDGLASPFVGGIYASPLADFQALLADLRFLRCRWDGQANDPPAQGDEIPLVARIVAVAEAFENLTGGRGMGGRATAPALTPLAAMRHLRRHAGAQFDPAVVRALVDAVRAADGPA